MAEVCPAFVYEQTEEDERGDTITFNTRFSDGIVSLNYQPGIFDYIFVSQYVPHSFRQNV